jgi:hypothetical protein
VEPSATAFAHRFDHYDAGPWLSGRTARTPTGASVGHGNAGRRSGRFTSQTRMSMRSTMQSAIMMMSG